MTEQEKSEIAEKIVEMIKSQRFTDWYMLGGRGWEYFINCNPRQMPPKEAIIADILSMLGL